MLAGAPHLALEMVGCDGAENVTHQVDPLPGPHNTAAFQCSRDSSQLPSLEHF
jgi:hypothetical protein